MNYKLLVSLTFSLLLLIGLHSLSLVQADTATLLPNGKVLVAGRKMIELYDPATKTWSRTDNLNTARAEFTATLLQNGKVLVVGGHLGRRVFDAAELYDPATGTWSPTGNLITGRWYHTATLLKNGKVLVAGGIGLADFSTALNYTTQPLEPGARPVTSIQSPPITQRRCFSMAKC